MLLQSYSDYHEELFPDTLAIESALAAAQWCSGDNAQVCDVASLLYVIKTRLRLCSIPAGTFLRAATKMAIGNSAIVPWDKSRRRLLFTRVCGKSLG